MTSSLSEIIYCSQERASCRAALDSVFAEILGVARRRNEGLGVTGALMYNSGYFTQLLEGPAETVDRLFDTIQADPRHHNIVLVSKGPITQRQFPDWAMGFAANPDDPAIVALLTRAVTTPDATIAEDLRTLLQQCTAEAVVWGLPAPVAEVT